jgi:type I restriction enzyme R subunit
MKGSQGAIAETIENNVRKKIIKDQHLDPAFFEKMSKLLEELIKQRKANAVTYEEYLKMIAELAKQTNTGFSDDTPDAIATAGMRALYNNLNKNDALVIQIDRALRLNSPADWRGNTAKENVVKSELYNILNSVDEVERVFKIVKEQLEY